jgi:hypothetical protein
MSLSISKALPVVEYDENGNVLTAAYWKITSISANVIAQTLSLTYSGYASSTAFNANPTQAPLATEQVNFPDANSPGYVWPFNPSSLASAYPNNPAAFLLAAEAYAMSLPFFSGATQVA